MWTGRWLEGLDYLPLKVNECIYGTGREHKYWVFHNYELQVYSWEPVVCHDTVDMGWSTLGDLCINEGKLLGCSYYRNSVGVWVADISVSSTSLIKSLHISVTW